MVYLDFNSTTPVSESVIRNYGEYLAAYGNPSSLHGYGRRAREQLEASRESIRTLLGLEEYGLVFTSGGTESNHLALEALAQKASGSRSRVLLTSIEHPCILYQKSRLEEAGYSVELIPVTKEGIVDLAWLRESLDESVALVAVMLANNETGVIQPAIEIRELCEQHRVHFHCDAAQGIGKMSGTLAAIEADTITISGHKFGAPKGIGALLFRQKPTAYFRGGDQEKGLRAGTENVAGAAAMQEALSQIVQGMPETLEGMQTLRDSMEADLMSERPELRIVSREAGRLVNTSCILLPDVDNDRAVIALDQRGYAISRGAACHSGVWGPSHVLLAQGYSRDDAMAAIRVSIGPRTTKDELRGFSKALVDWISTVSSAKPAATNPTPLRV